MSSQGIIRQTFALGFQLEHLLAGLEKHFHIPAFAVNADNLFFIEFRVCADNSKPVFPVGTVSHTYDFGGNGMRYILFICIADLYSCGKKISGTSSALFGSGKYLLDVQFLVFKLIANFRNLKEIS